MYIEPLISVKNEVSKEKLMQDLHLVMTDAEELLRATASHTGEKVSAARERIQESLSATKSVSLPHRSRSPIRLGRPPRSRMSTCTRTHGKPLVWVPGPD